MNDDDFEKKILEAASLLRLPDPTVEWRTTILAQARCGAKACPRTNLLPPRWLLFSWAAAWIVIAGLGMMTPSLPDAPAAPALADAPGLIPPSPTAAPLSPAPLFAYQFHFNPGLDFP